MKIHKTPLKEGFWPGVVELPGLPVHASMQITRSTWIDGEPMVWHLDSVAPGFAAQHRGYLVTVIGTGHDIPEGWTYLCTFQHRQPATGLSFVWHLFYRMAPQVGHRPGDIIRE